MLKDTTYDKNKYKYWDIKKKPFSVEFSRLFGVPLKGDDTSDISLVPEDNIDEAYSLLQKFIDDVVPNVDFEDCIDVFK